MQNFIENNGNLNPFLSHLTLPCLRWQCHNLNRATGQTGSINHLQDAEHIYYSMSFERKEQPACKNSFK